LSAASRVPIASIGKTVTAAQVLRLVEEGAIGIDDPAADHLPPELDAHDANGATVRELLGMRSGIDDEMFPGAGVSGRLDLQLREHELRCSATSSST
jgi:CubicO group peptidase (beta-lactamase class C family)